MGNFDEGSTWNRWDLHIHTPGTKKNDQYIGNNIEEKWNRFYDDIKNYIGDGKSIDKNIVSIGITDYLSIDNYNRIISDNKLPKSIKLVLPNIEMRILPIASDSPVNIHFIFDPEIVPSLQSRFFAKLSFTYGETNYSATKDQLKALGRKIKPDADDQVAYEQGINQFVPSLESIKTVFKNDPELRNSVIIAVSNSNGDGVSGAASHSSYCESSDMPSQLTLFRQSVYQFVDVIFSSKPSDIKYFLGEGSVDSAEDVKSKCGSLKPCLHGCDAHINSKIFEPDHQKYCWIKAVPTFNGLRQILYEPKERVRISTLQPETKPSYYVIDKVVIDDKEFSNQPIVFNDQLTCIIGGKSTGKSILLHNLAASIDPEQVNKKNETANNNVKQIENVKVFWADNTPTESSPEDVSRKIVYIPQTYLNRLSDENEELTEIDTIIQDIILLNSETKGVYEDVGQNIKTYKVELDKLIYDLLASKNKIKRLRETEKELGTLDGIEKELLQLQLKKELLSQDLNLSEDDIKEYDQAVGKIRTLNNEVQKIESDINYLSKINSVVEERKVLFDFSESTKQVLDTTISTIVKEADNHWKNSKDIITTDLDKRKLGLQDEIKKYVDVKEKLHEKIVSNDALTKLTKAIQLETEKREKILECGRKIKEETGNYNKLLQQAIDSMDFYKKQHENFAESVNTNTELTQSDLEFSVQIPFRKEAFCEKVKSISDKRTLKKIVKIDEFNEVDYTSSTIKDILEAILNGELPLIKGNTAETALRDILSDWYNTTYSVKMDNDPIELMSPGKKALVLLKLLISLADSKCPILIDQPEDDLDNRSIFDDLIPFIKEKKKERQIIIVTHNANIVLGSDADEVIVANQSGKNSPNCKYKFEYRTGAIEEDSSVVDDEGQTLIGILNQQGIQQHICDILEGGERAFDLRKSKYRI
ncbi:TrlF family AAA-like ATPase [Enterococcus casseliflavus]|uniref:TrlF family AAA-like ATPase n=1 Tax=Enterococcus casseliflavus TaxID=37734 RepID=UPI000E469729|nr:hypothetical protein [Enterococcus casseliflavus]RHH53633.1 hypothetical protein DW201_14395 [Enterococcus casseliflavus]